MPKEPNKKMSYWEIAHFFYFQFWMYYSLTFSVSLFTSVSNCHKEALSASIP